MLVASERRTVSRAARSCIGAFAVASLLLIALAVPMDAASDKSKLSSAAVSPRAGTTSTVITATVVYQNANGSRAEHVSVSFGTLTYEMTRRPGSSWGKGVTFAWSGKLPAGILAVVVGAVARDNSTATLAAGTVTITAPAEPTPAPRATPKPTPRPTPKATAAPTPTPTARSTTDPTRPRARAVAPTPTPTPPTTVDFVPLGPLPTGPGPWPREASIVVPAPQQTDPPTTAALIGGTDSGPAGPGDGPTGGGPVGAGSPTSPAGRDGGQTHGRGPVASALAIAGLQPPTFPGFAFAPTLVTTTGAVTAAMALGLFGRRRRDDDPSDEVLAMAAGNGIAVAAYDAIAAPLAGLPEEEFDVESLLPRWRRPSLLQARKADPIRDATPAPRLTFDEGLVGSLSGRERRVIRYRVVRLLDTPDELRGVEIGFLDQGDEVQLIEKYGAYWLVLAPDGQRGWLHKMTLGEMHDTDGATEEGPTASMPIAADSWTMAEADIDSDVLEAYLESRRRNA